MGRDDDIRQFVNRIRRHRHFDIVAGIFLAIVVAMLSELVSDTIYDPVRTERQLNVPTLAVFNYVPAEQMGR